MRAWRGFEATYVATKPRWISEFHAEKIVLRELSVKNSTAARKGAEAALVASIGKENVRYGKAAALPFLDEPYEKSETFSLKLIQNWIMRKVIDLGWTVDRFGRHDRDASAMTYREPSSRERIGKKYQWIAYHELAARLSDNFYLLGDSAYQGLESYVGPWQLGLRDLNPSFLQRRTMRDAEYNNCWWSAPIDEWGSEVTDEQWVKFAEDIPDIRSYMTAHDGDRTWLALDGIFNWEEPRPAGEERFESPTREFWWRIKAYLTRVDGAEAIDELRRRDYRDEMSGHGLHEVHLFEFPWADAFRYHDRAYYGRSRWRQLSEHLNTVVLACEDEYAAEMGYDNSFEGHVSIALPCAWLCENFDLHQSAEGEFSSRSDGVVFQDPSVRDRVGLPCYLPERSGF